MMIFNLSSSPLQASKQASSLPSCLPCCPHRDVAAERSIAAARDAPFDHAHALFTSLPLPRGRPLFMRAKSSREESQPILIP